MEILILHIRFFHVNLPLGSRTFIEFQTARNPDKIHRSRRREGNVYRFY